MSAQLEVLLYSRQQAMQMLNCSRSKLIRLENAGLLAPHRFDPAVKGRIYYAAGELEQLSRPRTQRLVLVRC